MHDGSSLSMSSHPVAANELIAPLSLQEGAFLTGSCRGLCARNMMMPFTLTHASSKMIPPILLLARLVTSPAADVRASSRKDP